MAHLLRSSIHHCKGGGGLAATERGSGGLTMSSSFCSQQAVVCGS